MDADDMPLSAQLDLLVNEKSYTKALDLCVTSEIEIESHSTSEDDKSQHSAFYFSYICLYLILSEYHGARHLFHRLPLGLKDQATFSVLWEVLKHLWNKRVPDALKLLLDFSWPGDNISLINAVVDAIRAAESRNISKLYRSVFLKDLERKLLLSNSDALLLCNQYGWSVDAAGAVSVTSVLSSEASRTSGETTLGSHGLEELTRIVLFLEKEPLTASSAVSSAGSALATSASAGTASAITAAASQGMAVDH